MRSRVQETFCIYRALITMVSQHNKALLPFIHLCFWECLRFGELHGRHKGTHCSGGGGTNLPFPEGRRPAGKVTVVIWIAIKKPVLHRQSCQGGRGGMAKMQHLQDRGLPGGSQAAPAGLWHQLPLNQTKPAENHPKTSLKTRLVNTKRVKRQTHVTGALPPNLQVEAGIETSFCSARI